MCIRDRCVAALIAGQQQRSSVSCGECPGECRASTSPKAPSSASPRVGPRGLRGGGCTATAPPGGRL
eukprot:12922034-Alexandrium_andersonii.AAC.1